MHLAPVFTLETNNQTYNECLPKFVQTHNASSTIKRPMLNLTEVLLACIVLSINESCAKLDCYVSPSQSFLGGKEINFTSFLQKNKQRQVSICVKVIEVIL